MKLGAFSTSLAVQDLQTSKEFYEKLGFSVFAGEAEHKYLIMKNGDTVIGLFEGMFKNNILTFNPGWNQNCETLSEFEDVRKLHKKIIESGVTTEQESLDGESGPGSFVMLDPDGNPILIDQHV
jgi:predicted lactoylglutathione lyase